MPWDVEGTKRRLLDAATAEFSERGLAGARVDRIAAAAGVNKQRIYEYFGSKDELFGAVLSERLALVMDAVPIEGNGIEAVADYAGRVFDYDCRNPEFARLTFWEGLERREPVARAFRAERSASKVHRLQEAVPQLGDEDAKELLLTILTLCAAFQALANVDRLYAGAAKRNTKGLARRRAAIVTTAEATVRATLAGRPGGSTPRTKAVQTVT
ncbi:MAG: TetR family transcriptional regulator [Candidatus Limnocylindrales bacterium]